MGRKNTRERQGATLGRKGSSGAASGAMGGVAKSVGTKPKAAKKAAMKAKEGEGVPHYPYVVRGAKIFCPYGTHIRLLDMPAAHGSFIRGKPMMNEDDCEVGLDANIAPFGGCHSPLNESEKVVDITIGPDEIPMPNDIDESSGEFIFPELGTVIEDVKLCTPELIGKWLETEEETLVGGKPALIMKCHITCSYACSAEGDARISFIDDGQLVE